MNKKIIAIIGTAAMTTCFTGCNLNKKAVESGTAGNVKTETVSQTESAISHVLYGEWTAFDINGTAVTGDERPYVIFDKSSDTELRVKCYANNGCNTLNGTFLITPGGKMQSGNEFASTMRLCADAKYEHDFNAALYNVANYNIEQVGSEYLLYLNDTTGKTLMVLRKADAGFMNGAWRVTRVADKDVAADKELQMVIDISDLKVHGKAGCNILNGAIFIDPAKQNSLQFRDLATTRMSCPDLALEQQFLLALEQVETVVPGKTSDTALLKDSHGKVLISLVRMNLK